MVERKADAICVKAGVRLVVEGTDPVGRPTNTWQHLPKMKPVYLGANVIF